MSSIFMRMAVPQTSAYGGVYVAGENPTWNRMYK